jgi:DNA-binding transcriptional LysR family regulator
MLDIAVVLEPAQLDVLRIEEVATLELILVSSESGLGVDEALEGNYVFVDWGLSFGLDHRRTFPDAPEAPTRVSQGTMALDYLLAIGGSAYLPRAMVGEALRSGELHAVHGAPTFARCAYAIYPVRSPRLELLTESLRLFQIELTG